MGLRLIFTGFLVASLYICEITAHGRLWEPAGRSTVWRVIPSARTPVNHNDNSLYCGGIKVHYQQNGGKCGPCGDNYAHPRPRANENGGIYGTGFIVRQYKVGQKINISVELTANHLGHFEFSLCPLKSKRDLESEECFNKHPLLVDGSFKYPVKSKTRFFNVTAALPPKFACEHCAFRWHYRAGNNWGFCDDGTGKLGCGEQEFFRGCADVSIL